MGSLMIIKLPVDFTVDHHWPQKSSIGWALLETAATLVG